MVVADEVIDTNAVTATAAVTDTITLQRYICSCSYRYTNGCNNAAIDAVSGLRGWPVKSPANFRTLSRSCCCSYSSPFSPFVELFSVSGNAESASDLCAFGTFNFARLHTKDRAETTQHCPLATLPLPLHTHSRVTGARSCKATATTTATAEAATRTRTTTTTATRMER